MDCFDQQLCPDYCRKEWLIKIWKTGKNCDHCGKKIEKRYSESFSGEQYRCLFHGIGPDITMMVVGRA